MRNYQPNESIAARKFWNNISELVQIFRYLMDDSIAYKSGLSSRRC